MTFATYLVKNQRTELALPDFNWKSFCIGDKCYRKLMLLSYSYRHFTPVEVFCKFSSFRVQLPHLDPLIVP